MLYRLIDLEGYVWEFTTLACAKLYQQTYGGRIEILEAAEV